MADRRRKVVRQYNLDGVLVAEYNSLSDVAAINGFSAGNISNCCNGVIGNRACYGYYWRYADNEDGDCTGFNHRVVRQYTPDGKLVSEYMTLSAASRALDVSIGRLSRCCSKKCKTAAGYVWRWSNDDELEKVG